jgi:hypothetical protein
LRSLDAGRRTIRPADKKVERTPAYCDSKLHVTALALVVARYWPNTLGNVVDPVGS